MHGNQQGGVAPPAQPRFHVLEAFAQIARAKILDRFDADSMRSMRHHIENKYRFILINPRTLQCNKKDSFRQMT